MFEIKLERVVEQIVRHNLIGQGRETEALYINFDVRLHNYDNENNKEFYTSRGLHLLYYSKSYGGAISVFSAVTVSPFDRIYSVEEWKHEVTHDSCWRDVRVFSETYFKMADEINAQRKKEKLDKIAPCEMTQHCSFAGIASNHLFKWVEVLMKKDTSDSYNYRRTIKVVQK